MKVLFLTVGAQAYASSRTRVYQYLPHLAQHGIDAKVLSAEPNMARYLSAFHMRLNGPLRKIYGRLHHIVFRRLWSVWLHWNCQQAIKIAREYDLVFIQKLDLPVDLYDRLRGSAKRIVYDIDDPIYLSEVRRARIEEQIRTADLTIVASDYLVAHVQALSANVAVLPTPVDVDHYRPRIETIEDSLIESKSALAMKPVTIGWIGSDFTSKYLEEGSPFLRQLLLQFGDRIRFSFVGADPEQVSLRPAKFYSWSLETEVAHLQTFDIGIMPLPELDEWARGKAGYKLLQYMAMGIPGVASPVGANKTIIEHGCNGFLATAPSEWIEYLGRLIDSPQLRETMGAEGRRMAEERYSHRYFVDKLVDLLTPLTILSDINK